jgi:hypothetical protein
LAAMEMKPLTLLLTQTRKTLRSFISENFSIDDLLYVFERPA